MKRNHETYIVEITGWSWGYGHGIEDSGRGRRDKQYYEHDGVTVTGTIRKPIKLAGQPLSLIFWPYPELNGTKRISTTHVSAGWIDDYNEEKGLTGGVRFPADKLSSFLTVLATGRWKWIDINGTPLVKREASIIGFSMLEAYESGSGDEGN